MADGPNMLLDAVVLLGGAAVAAPLFKRIGLGTVLGYLSLGLVLGPILNYIHNGEDVLHIAELGVVMLLFLVGLELKPQKLWEMRSEIFGLGLAQVVISGIVLSIIAWAVYYQPTPAIVVGFGLALSSTAFALQILEDRGESRTAYGQRAFSILLFQDIAIAPLLILVSILALGRVELDGGNIQQIAIAIGAVVALIGIGRYLLNPMFGIIAETGAREAMIAAALFVVIGSAVLMQYAGLSMAMGAFIAGVMLAESSYRHELEADIEPFRGILLGLFFIAVGLAVDLSIVWENIVAIFALVPALMLAKGIIIYVLCRMFGSDHNNAIRVALILPQHGEFGFVLFSAAASAALLNAEESSFLIALVTISMAFTPLCVSLATHLTSDDEPEQMEEDFAGADSHILMIGFSRVGQIAAQTLLAGGLKITVLDNSAERVRQAQRFGFRIYFGDGTRKDVLKAAGIENAKYVAVATNSPAVTNRVVELIADQYPGKKLFVRTYDRGHALDLLAKHDLWQIRETFESALVMGRALLKAAGFSEDEAFAIVDDVRARDKKRLRQQMTDGFLAGRENLHSAPVPEPLIDPLRRRQFGESSVDDHDMRREDAQS
ncbi:MAG: monovalent cation:proton antiporter-2 (CPA2) family protein [Ahrensia sp.]|nr:monovalent cation:proton antiporter-2 (CPA2) family protein [Ahrensia sp.]